MNELHGKAEAFWNWDISTHDEHPFTPYALSDEVAPDVWFFKDFVNVTGIGTDDGLVLIDTGSYTPNQHMRCFNGIREHTGALLHTAVYTHGHVDHAYGLPPWIAETREAGGRYPTIIGHENVAPRMDRYIETEGYNNVINERQFGVRMHWPTDPIKPTLTYRTQLELTIGGRQLQLHHSRGETDDHTWVFLPESRVLMTGDLFIWAAPNAGNPQKVQRYARDWAVALRRMASLAPVVLCPGHGVPVYGEDRVRQALENTATYLESLYADTLELINQGARIYDILESVSPPSHLVDLPYLQPIYDEPDFIVRNIARHLCGWYSGVPSELHPPGRHAIASELVALAGGMGALVQRIEVLLAGGEARTAAHFIDYAFEADPGSAEIRDLRARVYRNLAESATSTMSRGIYGAAVRESEED